MRIIITSLFCDISLVHRPRERKLEERVFLNSSSVCAVTCYWMCFDGEIAISWPSWKEMGVAFIGSLIATSKRCLFFAQILNLFHRIFCFTFSILNSGNFRLIRQLIYENRGTTAVPPPPDHFHSKKDVPLTPSPIFMALCEKILTLRQ